MRLSYSHEKVHDDASCLELTNVVSIFVTLAIKNEDLEDSADAPHRANTQKNNNKRQLQNDKLVEKSRNFCYLEFCPKMRLFKVIFQDYELQEFPLVTMQ